MPQGVSQKPPLRTESSKSHRGVADSATGGVVEWAV
jgi:hypothetical protein